MKDDPNSTIDTEAKDTYNYFKSRISRTLDIEEAVDRYKEATRVMSLIIADDFISEEIRNELILKGRNMFL